MAWPNCSADAEKRGRAVDQLQIGATALDGTSLQHLRTIFAGMLVEVSRSPMPAYNVPGEAGSSSWFWSTAIVAHLEHP